MRAISGTGCNDPNLHRGTLKKKNTRYNNLEKSDRIIGGVGQYGARLKDNMVQMDIKTTHIKQPCKYRMGARIKAADKYIKCGSKPTSGYKVQDTK